MQLVAIRDARASGGARSALQELPDRIRLDVNRREGVNRH